LVAAPPRYAFALKTGNSIQIRGLNLDPRLSCSHNFLSASVLTGNVGGIVIRNSPVLEQKKCSCALTLSRQQEGGYQTSLQGGLTASGTGRIIPP
jgi:hypothetical protein